MNVTSTLLYGSVDDVLTLLDSRAMDEAELRAVLMNAFQRIAQLENQLRRVTVAEDRG